MGILVESLEEVVAAAEEEREVLAPLLFARCESLVDAAVSISARCANGGRLLVLGLGPCAADAERLSVELVRPVIDGTPSIPTVDISRALADGGAPTVAGLVAALGVPGDVLVTLSPSDDDPALVCALRSAGCHGIVTVSLTGGDGGELAGASGVDYLLAAGCSDRQLVKEHQLATCDLLCELVQSLLQHRTLGDQSTLGGQGRSACTAPAHTSAT